VSVTTDEIEIGAAPCKTCQLDPAPTLLVKEMRGPLSLFISLLFNKSLAKGYFLSAYKKACVYVHCHYDDTTTIVQRLELCIPDVRHRMSAIMQTRLNAEKTKLIWIRFD